MRFLQHISEKIIDFQARILLSLLFIAILPFFTLIWKKLRRQAKSAQWLPWSMQAETIDDLKKQF